MWVWGCLVVGVCCSADHPHHHLFTLVWCKLCKMSSQSETVNCHFWITVNTFSEVIHFVTTGRGLQSDPPPVKKCWYLYQMIIIMLNSPFLTSLMFINYNIFLVKNNLIWVTKSTTVQLPVLFWGLQLILFSLI